MKKIALLLVLLLSFGAFVFAQEEEAAEEPVEITMEDAADAIARLEALEAQVEGAKFVPAVAGSATMTFGVDLDDEVSMGFKNEFTSTFSISVLSVTESDEPDADPVGYISVSGAALSFSAPDTITMTAGSVTAGIKLAGGMVDVVIYSAPSLSLGNAAGFIDANADGVMDHNYVSPALTSGNTTAAASSSSATAITLIDYADYDATTDTVLDTEDGDAVADATDDWLIVDRTTTTTTAATAAAFQGITANINVEPLTLSLLIASAGGYYNVPQNDTTDDNINDFAFGLKVSGSFDPINLNAGLILGPTDGMDIGFTAGIDGTFGPATVDVGFDGWVPEGGDFGFDASLGIDLDVPTSPSIDYYLWNTGTMNMGFKVGLDIGSMVENLTLTTAFRMMDVLTSATQWWDIVASLAYQAGTVKPFVDYSYASSTIMTLSGGLVLTVVENTTMTLKYATTDLGGADNGLITFATAISL